MSENKLNPDQIAHFETFGFLHFPNCFPSEEFKSILKVAEELWTRKVGHKPNIEEDIHLDSFLESDPRLMRLIHDDRIYEPVHGLLGDGFIWSGSEGNHGFPKDNTSHHWHADRAGEKELGYIRIKIMLYTEPMRKEQGALRVIPGSHRLPLHRDLMSFQRRHSEKNPSFYGMSGDQVPCYAIESEPGDMLIFNHSLFHGVYGKQGLRRYIALKFAACPTCDANFASLQYWSPYAFEPNEVLIQSEQPRIRNMVEGLKEMGIRGRRVVGNHYQGDWRTS
ncbi:MAG: hypothetical protein DF168_00391 [Candidatus Moanabacter tarae]|uniref:Phytanoyl-CoA dioxygenase family protein n=1 Tax=Candidatus Moanibacter tarae TaxID=2200854 RepID=A0A2Z4AKK6_9BACT|nr:MAG: hypothetical protein DF168_00391 [Candidatus Moanabacter tarae]|tara:strand:+ start:2967 stop:3803 length:837 start_codon:yes stop_codon:yes gene_type:complete